MDVSLVLPLEDPRGDIAEHLRTWTDEQELERDRYQVVVGADGAHPDFEREVAGLLQPQDAMVRVPGASLMGLYAAAAEAATGEVLVLTEAHCLADPGCLGRVAESFADDPELDAATLSYRQNVSSPVGELTDRWFERVFRAWDQADWTRFNNAGVAIRRRAYDRAGGIDPRLELYATSYMSARLHDLGARVRHLDDAVLTHELEDQMWEALGASRSFTRGECAVRREQPPEFCERYFGSAGLWDRRLCYRPEIARPMVAALASAIRSDPRESAWLYRELAARAPAAVAGTRPRWAWEKVTARLHQAIAQFGQLPVETRWRSYVDAQDRTVRSVQLEESAKRNGLPSPLAAGSGEIAAEHLSDVLVGAGSLEQSDGRRFRWTEPVALLRVSPPPGGALMRVDTGGLRGRPSDYLHGVYCGGDALPAAIGGDESFEVRIPPSHVAEAAERGIVVLADPLVPSSRGSSDRRRLGVPVVAVELSAL